VRSLLVDAFGLALAMLAVLLLLALFGGPPVEAFRHFTFFALGLAPVVFLAGLLDTRLARSEVGELLVDLRADPTQDLQRPLARVLHDPTVRVVYWLPEYHAWSDKDGNPEDLPEPGAGRAVRIISRDDSPIAALDFDPTLADEHELLDAVDAAAGIALENARLRAELRARLEELHGSRARMLEAGQRERRRLERDLHDGAQQRLVNLSLELGLLGRAEHTDAQTRDRLLSLKDEVSASLEELRDVAHGIHPAVLSAHGLDVALEQLAAGATLPVGLDIPSDLGRLPEPVETAAYYLVSESLANIGKHAEAAQASISLAREGPTLVVTVVDDGRGGADPDAGVGLRGLADRVEALHGRLHVWSPPDAGTTLRADIPCGS
jgi:signal transduction histidine kinase